MTCACSIAARCGFSLPPPPCPPGDLLYLDVTTLEGVWYCVTACPAGFFLNKSSGPETFDPRSRKTSHLSKHLVGLLSQVGVAGSGRGSGGKWVCQV